MRIATRWLAAAILGIALSAPARADFLNLVGGTAGSIPGGATNNFISAGLFPGPGIGGYFGGQVFVDVPIVSTVIIEFFGAEAGFHNEFNLVGSELFAHPGGTIIAPSLAAPLGTFGATIVGSGLLPFRFDVNGDAGTVANGSNPDDSVGAAVGPNFFATCNPFSSAPGSGGTTCSSLYLFLDDGGAGPDDNHDDFLVRITIRSPVVVPEPATLALLGMAVATLGLGRRRKLH